MNIVVTQWSGSDGIIHSLQLTTTSINLLDVVHIHSHSH